MKIDDDFENLASFTKFLKNSPRNIYDLIPANINSYQTRNSRNLLITQLKVRNNFFNFFPSALVEWNNLDLDIRNSSSYPISKKNILTFIRPRFNNVFNISHPKGRSFPSCLRIGLSYLRKYMFKHSSLDTLNPICICGLIWKH